MKRQLSLIMVLVLATGLINSCKDMHNKNNVTFNLEEVLGKKRFIKLSEIAKSIRYVKLETNKDVVLGSNNVQVLAIDDYLYVLQADKPLSVFTSDGKFVRTFGSIGRGPGEYTKSYTFSVDQSGKRIFILNKIKGTILTFNEKGEFQNEIIPEKSAIEFEYLGNDLLCACIRTEGIVSDTNCNYLIFNDKGKTINKFYIPGSAYREFKMEGSSLPFGMQLTPYFASSPSGVNIFTFQNDSIFTATEKGEIFPSLAWNCGKYKAPFFDMDPNIEKSEKEKYVRSMAAIETENFWFVGFRLQNKFYKAIMDKRDNQFFEIEDSKNAIINDIDGGPSFWPFFESYKGKYFATPLDPIYLKKQLEDGMFDQPNIKFPDKNRELKDMITSLDISDNQIIRIVELR